MFSPLSIGISAGLGATAGLGLAAGGFAYAAMWPASQLFGPTLIAPPRPDELALTFDDGPNPAWTPSLLGSHSWSHLNLALASASRIEEQLSRTSETLEQITGAPVRYFRPPFGARRPETLRIARQLGLIPVLWNAMTSDWKNPSADAIAKRLMRKIDSLARRGHAANIVLHDGSHADPAADRAPSIAAAAQLIARYQPTHEFVTVAAWS